MITDEQLGHLLTISDMPDKDTQLTSTEDGYPRAFDPKTIRYARVLTDILDDPDIYYTADCKARTIQLQGIGIEALAKLSLEIPASSAKITVSKDIITINLYRHTGEWISALLYSENEIIELLDP